MPRALCGEFAQLAPFFSVLRKTVQTTTGQQVAMATDRNQAGRRKSALEIRERIERKFGVLVTLQPFELDRHSGSTVIPAEAGMTGDGRWLMCDGYLNC